MIGDVTVRAVAELDRYAFGVAGVKGMAGRHVTFEFDPIAVAATTLPAARSDPRPVSLG